MKLLSLFSGIGAFEKALDRLGVEYDLVNYCEIDRYASKAYSLIHNVPESLNLGDITKVDADSLPKDIDLLTYGFPCQDISIAGNCKGFEYEGKTTRSGLFFDALRIIEAVKPRYAIAENVKNLTSDSFREEFTTVLDCLDKAGYDNYHVVLNAKDFGVPQNRERVFIVSIRRDVNDDCFGFPKGFPLKRRLKDVLESNVDEKYYLSDDAVNVMVQHRLRNEAKGNGFGAKFMDGNEVCSTLVTGSYKSNSPYLKVKQIGNVRPSSTRENPNQGRVYDSSGLSPTLGCMEGGSRQPFVKLDYRIRKLTPKECFRLMGFDDADVDVLISNGISDSQLYKMAGNSIVVDVLVALLRNVLRCKGCDVFEPSGSLF